MRDILGLSHVLAALLYAAIGLAVFFTTFIVFDKVTPYDLWQEIVHKQNRALAIVVGSLSIGMCIVIAAAIVG